MNYLSTIMNRNKKYLINGLSKEWVLLNNVIVQKFHIYNKIAN